MAYSATQQEYLVRSISPPQLSPQFRVYTGRPYFRRMVKNPSAGLESKSNPWAVRQVR